jgi:FixJ family two-component response regulator
MQHTRTGVRLPRGESLQYTANWHSDRWRDTTGNPISSHELAMKENVTREAVVVVIDDNASVRAALKDMLESVGLVVKLYASGSAFLEDRLPDATSCLVLDVRLPETSGIKIQEKLARAGVYVPVVFVSGHADVAMAVGAMKAGAIDFLTKPFRSQDLLDAVFAALERDSARRKMQQLHSTIREHLESLSAREREVIARVTTGNLNKQIAADLGLSEVTVKVHRANAMRKMHATSLAHLIKMLEHFNTGELQVAFALRKESGRVASASSIIEHLR